MYYNLKNEKIYYMSPTGENRPLNIFLAGITMPNPDYIIAHNISAKDNFDRYQFEYVLDGKGYIEINSEIHKVGKGDFFFINKSCQRIYYSDKDEPFKKMFITVNGTLIDGLVGAYRMDVPLIIKKADVSEYFEMILRILENCGENTEAAYEETAVELLKIMQIINRGNRIESSKEVVDRAEAIMNYIDQNIYRSFTLDELSDYFFLSKTQLLRIFEEKYNTSPMKYAVTKRVALSMYYLSKTKIPISTVAEIFSFSDAKYFSKVFKKYVNRTPREYRRECFDVQKKTIDSLLESINK